MGMEKDTLLGLHRKLHQTLRLNYIPPWCMPDKVLGLRPHSDPGTISMLMQEGIVNGLQIRKDGKWMLVTPIPNAFVVNVGDVAEIWSNVKYKSIEHRVVANESKARISYASFIYPHWDAEVGPLDEMVDTSRMYMRVKYGDYLMTSLSGEYRGKGHTEIAD